MAMTAKDVRQLALSLPEAVEEPHMQRTSFRVRGRIFATISEDERQAVVMVKEPDLLTALLADRPDMFVDLGGWTRLGALGVVLTRADRVLFRQVLVDAWKRIAPKRALALYEKTVAKVQARPPRS
jgi:hypothetical protein